MNVIEKVEQLIEKVGRYKLLKDNARGVIFYMNGDLTTLSLDCSNFVSMNTSFYNCYNLERLYLSNTHNVEIWAQSIRCWKLKTLETLDFSALTVDNIINKNNFSCDALENLKLVPNTLKVSAIFYQEKLTLESGKSILLGLYNYSGTDKEFTHTITLSTATWALLEADGNTAPNNMTWAEYVDSIGWNT